MEQRTARASAVRIVVVAIVALFALANSVSDIVLPWHPFADLGLTVDASHTIVAIDPGRPADRAGLRAGDRIDDAGTPASTRRYFGPGISAVPEGRPLTLSVRTPNGLRTVTLTGEPRPRSFADNATNAVLNLAYFASIAVGAWLLLVRPSRMTWAFFLFCCGALGTSLTFSVLLSDALFPINVALWGALTGAAGVMFIVFALRFPHDRADGWRRIAERIALASLAVLAPLGAYTFVASTSGWPLALANTVATVASAVELALGALVFVVTYTHAPAVDRAKIRWVGVGLAIGFAGQLAFSIGTSVPGLAVEWPIPVINLVTALPIAIPLSVAYVIVRHRVFDVRFVLRRAVVYGLVTSVVVAVVALLDFLIGKIVAQTQLAVVGDAGVAIAVGVSLNMVHRRVEGTVERILFRDRRRADERLHRIGEGLMHAGSANAIAQAIVVEASAALNLSSVAFFRREHTAFVCAASRGWSDADGARLESDASAALAVAARREPLAVRNGSWPAGLFPHGHDAPVFVLPVLLRGELEAMVFVGAHTSGEQIDPEELAMLSALCDAAAVALEHVNASQALARVASLEAEVSALRRVVAATR
jgi:hypothetical protein